MNCNFTKSFYIIIAKAIIYYDYTTKNLFFMHKLIKLTFKIV